jgi:hypothetical protein
MYTGVFADDMYDIVGDADIKCGYAAGVDPTLLIFTRLECGFLVM